MSAFGGKPAIKQRRTNEAVGGGATAAVTDAMTWPQPRELSVMLPFTTWTLFTSVAPD